MAELTKEDYIKALENLCIIAENSSLNYREVLYADNRICAIVSDVDNYHGMLSSLIDEYFMLLTAYEVLQNEFKNIEER